MTEQTSPTSPKAHAASEHAEKPSARPGPTPLDIAARAAVQQPAATKPAVPKPVAPKPTTSQHPAPQPGAAEAPGPAAGPSLKTKVTGAQALVMTLERVGVEV